MDIAGTSPGASGKDPRMHLALGFAFTNGRKYFGEHVVEKVGSPFLLGKPHNRFTVAQVEPNAR